MSSEALIPVIGKSRWWARRPHLYTCVAHMLLPALTLAHIVVSSLWPKPRLKPLVSGAWSRESKRCKTTRWLEPAIPWHAWRWNNMRWAHPGWRGAHKSFGVHPFPSKRVLYSLVGGLRSLVPLWLHLFLWHVSVTCGGSSSLKIWIRLLHHFEAQTMGDAIISRLCGHHSWVRVDRVLYDVILCINVGDLMIVVLE